MTEIGAFASQLHPLVVHLPIGALLVAAVLDVLSRTRRFGSAGAAVGPVAMIAAAAAAFAATTGYVRGSSGGYGGDTFAWHQRAGVALAMLSVLTAAAYVGAARRARPRAIARVLLWLTLPLVAIAGHLGGTLTHGEGYLTERLPWRRGADAPSVTRARAASQIRVYADLVAPVLAERCVRCHGAVEPAGELRLDSPEGVRKGGHSGPVIVAGRSSASEMVRRLWLPPSDKDAMPPRGRHAPTAAEASLIRWWIDQGAPFDRTLADTGIDAALRPFIEARVGRIDPGMPAILAVKVPPADAAALATIRALGVSVRPLAAGTPLLDVQCRAVAATFGDRELAALTPLAPQVTWLGLSGTRITDAGLAVLSRFANLTRVHLDRTAIGDAGLAHLSGLAHLEYLNLYGTNVTDEGVARLAPVRSLRELYLWRTAVTPAGAERLRAALPRLQVDLGTPEAVAADYDARGKPASR